MRKNKKSVAWILALAMMGTFILSGCGQQEKEPVAEEKPPVTQTKPEEEPKEPVEITVGSLVGPTSLGMLSLMEQNDKGETKNEYTFEITGDPTEMAAKMIQGQVDVAAMPTNLAATLFTKTEGKVQMAAINTLGVLYLVSPEGAISSFSDVAGQTIYATGQGSTPEYVLNYLLEKNEIKDAQVEYKTEHSELASLVVAGKAEIAMLPEPFVTTVAGKSSQPLSFLNLAEQWEEETDCTLAMGCIVVQKEFAEENQEAFHQFLEEYAASVQYSNENPEEAGKLSSQYGIIEDATIAAQAIPRCNMVYIDGEEMAEDAAQFLEVLYEANPKSIGGVLPTEEFYYKK